MSNRTSTYAEPAAPVADRHHTRLRLLTLDNVTTARESLPLTTTAVADRQLNPQTPARRVDRRVASTAANRRAEPMRPIRGWYLPLKAVFDFGAGLVLLVLLSPVIALAALLVKLTSRGPAFYLQTRVGRHGRPFRIIKLRSMRFDAEAKTGAVWCTTNDDRITPIGVILRATHLDELPQLINVVKGEMSLVGPRPERPEFVSDFEKKIEGYAARLLVRPGITGVAQLRLPPDTDLESVKDKLEFDLYYVRHVGLWLDLVAVAMTGFNFLTSILSAVMPSSLQIPTQAEVRKQGKVFIRRRDQRLDQPLVTPSGTLVMS